MSEETYPCFRCGRPVTSRRHGNAIFIDHYGGDCSTPPPLATGLWVIVGPDGPLLYTVNRDADGAWANTNADASQGYRCVPCELVEEKRDGE